MNQKVRQRYEELAQSLGFRLDTEGYALYGQRGTYDMILFPQDSNYPFMLTVLVSARRAAGPLSKEDCKKFKKENKPVASLVQNGLSITMSLPNRSRPEQLQEMLSTAINSLVRFLQSQGFQNCCQTCGGDHPSPCCISGAYMHLCQNCYGQVQHTSSMDYSRMQAKKENVIAGIVGALLGSLLGVASIIIFSQLGYVAAVSGIIMAICTLKGYEMLGGKLSTKGIVISILLMILMTGVGDRVDWAIAVAKQLEIGFMDAFRLIPALVSNDIIDLGAYAGNLILQYLFVLLGAVPTIINAVKSRKLQGRIYRLGQTVVSQEQVEL